MSIGSLQSASKCRIKADMDLIEKLHKGKKKHLGNSDNGCYEGNGRKTEGIILGSPLSHAPITQSET